MKIQNGTVVFVMHDVVNNVLLEQWLEAAFITNTWHQWHDKSLDIDLKYTALFGVQRLRGVKSCTQLFWSRRGR